LSWSVNLTSVRDLTAKADSTKRSRLEGTVAAFLSAQVRMRRASAPAGGAPHATTTTTSSHPSADAWVQGPTLPRTSVASIHSDGSRLQDVERGPSLVTRPAPAVAGGRCPGIVLCAGPAAPRRARDGRGGVRIRVAIHLHPGAPGFCHHERTGRVWVPADVSASFPAEH
jgi:hypothetical protein